MSEDYDIIIVGGGMGGSAATLRAVQYNLKACWFYGSKSTSKSSRSKWIYNIDNMIGFHEGVVKDELLKMYKAPEDEAFRQKLNESHVHISGKAILDNTRKRIESEYSGNIKILDTAAKSARREENIFIVSDGENEAKSEYMVVATGIMDTQPHIMKERGGEIIDSTKWIYPFANRETILYCIRCEGHLARSDNVAILGSGKTAEQLSFIMYERYGVNTFILTNGEEMSSDEESKKLLTAYGIKIYTDRIVDAVGEKGGQLRKFILAGGEEIEVKFALVAMGLHRVYNELVLDLGARLTDENQPAEIRHVIVDKKSETSIPNLFAVGDMAKRDNEILMKQIYTAQEYAVRAVDTIDSRRRMKMRDKIQIKTNNNKLLP
ncbi:MAG: NAD(P)/FAD-dependent oxidoreductase [Candidatus Marinimicrobia bacterium]|nr:NAD(P)/FAD-dependent oxidoreductase [Candidatus Neomarinimicrobiota bacterium]